MVYRLASSGRTRTGPVFPRARFAKIWFNYRVFANIWFTKRLLRARPRPKPVTTYGFLSGQIMATATLSRAISPPGAGSPAPALTAGCGCHRGLVPCSAYAQSGRKKLFDRRQVSAGALDNAPVTASPRHPPPPEPPRPLRSRLISRPQGYLRPQPQGISRGPIAAGQRIPETLQARVDKSTPSSRIMRTGCPACTRTRGLYRERFARISCAAWFAAPFAAP